MARPIDADALMKYIRNHDYQLVSRMGCVDKGMFTDGIEHGINIQPTVDAVPVVRCKDCKSFKKNGDTSSRGCAWGACRKGSFPCVYADDFCSRGERRSDD